MRSWARYLLFLCLVIGVAAVQDRALYERTFHHDFLVFGNHHDGHEEMEQHATNNNIGKQYTLGSWWSPKSDDISTFVKPSSFQSTHEPKISDVILKKGKRRNLEEMKDEGNSVNLPLEYFTAELKSRSFVNFTLYISEESGMMNNTCDDYSHPCPSIAEALNRLDELVVNWTHSMNQTLFNEGLFNIHVKLEMLSALKGTCANQLVTPLYNNINYLFEIYSTELFVISCTDLVTSLFQIRSDMTRFYFHEVKLQARLSSTLNYNLGIYNSVLSFASISIAEFQARNFTIGDAIFQEVYSIEEVSNIDISNVNTIKFIQVAMSASRPFALTIANCRDVELSGCYFNFLSLRGFSLTNFVMKDSISVGSNIVITKASSSTFSMVGFTLSKSYLAAVAVDFVENVKISHCEASFLDVFVQLGAIKDVVIEHTNVHDCNILGTYKNVKSIIEIISASSTLIEHSNFNNNIGHEGGVFAFVDIIALNIDNSTFIGNTADSYGGAISVSFSENAYFYQSYISNSTFIRNKASSFGGAIFFLNPFTVHFINCLFQENLSFESGGALFIRQEMVSTQFTNTKFIGNQVLVKSEAKVGKMLKGCGGAFTVYSLGKGDGYKDIEFIGNIALRGGAFCLGMTNFWNRTPYLLDSLRFISNYANISGGAIFIGEQYNLIAKESEALIGPNNIFKNNRAGIFGNEISASGKHLTLYSFTPAIESGQNVTLDIQLMGNLNIDIPLLSESFFVSSELLHISSYFSYSGNSLSFTSYFTSPIIENTTATINITTESTLTKHFNITLMPCHPPLRMVKEILEEKQVYVCKNIIDVETLIISITVPVGVLMLLGGAFLGFIIFYCTSKIVSKLKVLKKKEKAEKNLEKTILDNKIVFEMSDSDTNYTQPTQTSKKNYYSNEFNSPLLENDHTVRNDLVNKSSVVIPVEDIEITKRIGEGGYGNVYKGLWVSTEVAIKSLKTTEGNYEFEKEAAILSRMRHPNIVSFYGVCITDTSKYMVTEFVKKGSLDKIIYKCKQNIEFLSLKEKINILIGVSNGMNYLHSLQPSVIHRDLKPANILLDELNNPKVCDFGLVKIIGQNQMQSTMSVNVGTLFYISNESLVGSNLKITHKTDIYSFGIVMYELYFLENPYLNASCSKIHYFRKATSEDQPYTVPIKVLNNERPIIPFNNSEELQQWMTVYGQETSAPISALTQVTECYMKLMKLCWDMNPNMRPDFSEISKQLIQLRDQLTFH